MIKSVANPQHGPFSAVTYSVTLLQQFRTHYPLISLMTSTICFYLVLNAA